MRNKIISYIGAAVVATSGVVVATASPAFAAGGCDMANQSLGACFSYTGGSNARADFYLNRAPDWSTHSYSVSLIINGSEKVVKGKTKFGGTGRYCCWYTHVDGQPNRWQTGRTKVVVYTASGGVHFSSLSPVYSFNA